MDTSFCSNAEELPDVYISSVERIFTADHAINFALHAWQGCSTINLWFNEMGTFISIIKQPCSHCAHVYGCGTANHSSRTARRV